MKIERIELDGFGHFSGYSPGSFDAPLTVLHGPNEAGKSTLLAAIRAILFGFPLRGGKDHYPPLEGGRHGGRLHVVSTEGERLVIERHQGARGGPVTVFGKTGAQLADAMLHRLLGGHSEHVFRQIFAFTLDELTSSKLLEDSEINGQIYSAGIGAARLPQAIRAIAVRRDEIFAPRGRKHRMVETGHALEEKRSQLREATQNADRFAALTEEARQLGDAADEAARRRGDLQAELGRARQLEQAWEPWNELVETERELELLTVADFPANGIPRLELLEERVRNAASAEKTARLRVTAARSDADVQIEHEGILSRSAEVLALQSGMDHFRSAVNDLPRREQERDSLQAQLDDALGDLGDDWDIARLEAFRFSGSDESEVGQHRLHLEESENARRTAKARQEDATETLRAAEPHPDDDDLLARTEEIKRVERGRAAFADAVASLPAARTELQAAGSEADRALGELSPGWTADQLDQLDQLDLSIEARGEIGEFAERLRQADDETKRLRVLAEQSELLLKEARREETTAGDNLAAVPQPALDAEAVSERRRTVRAMRARLREAEAARQRIDALEGQIAAAGGPGAEATEGKRDWNRIIGGLGALAGIAVLAIGVALGGASLVVGSIAGLLLAAIGASLFFLSRARALDGADSPIIRNTHDALRGERDSEKKIADELTAGAAALAVERIDEDALDEAGAALDRATDALRDRDGLARRLTECEARRKEREQATEAAVGAVDEALSVREARGREWSAWLAQRGLRDDFRPDNVSELLSAATVARQAIAAQRGKREHVKRLERIASDFSAEVEPLAAQFGMQAADDPAALEAAAVQLVERLRAAARRADDFERDTETASESEAVLASAVERKAKAASAWGGWLAAHGLDAGLAPDAVLRLRERVETARAQRRLLAGTERRIDGVRKIIDEYAATVAVPAAAFGIAIDMSIPTSVEHAAQRLIDLRTDVARRVDERRVASERLTEAEQVLAEALTDLGEARRELNALLDRGGALQGEDLGRRAEDFRRRAAAFDERQAALDRKTGLERQLRRLFGSGERHIAAVSEIRTLDRQQIAARCKRIEGLVADADAEFGEASEGLGTVRQQLADLGSGSESSRLRMEQERLIEQARDDAREWAKLQLAGWLLARTRAKFEAERQPDVLRHAQEFLAAASGGRYRQVQAPLGEQRINAVEAGGAAKLPAQLSRGTREQLYLALRFGLIRELGERTERMPVVVDEVLVNFDPERALHAARAFHRLAETHQVLVFTCHPETVERFARAAELEGAPAPQVIEL